MANEMRDRLKENISIIKRHNETGLPVKHITKGQKYEVEVIAEIVEDVSLIIEKMEKETLIELPCKVGDTVYYLDGSIIVESKVHCISFGGRYGDYKGGQIHIYDSDKGNITVKLDNFGKTVFLTKAEAEQKLKEMRGADNG